MQLEVFDPQNESEAPIVSLRTNAGDTLWCIWASAYEGTSVDKIRFRAYQKLPFLRPRVTGLVEWTYGHERTLWYLDSRGDLVEYWYSW